MKQTYRIWNKKDTKSSALSNAVKTGNHQIMYRIHAFSHNPLNTPDGILMYIFTPQNTSKRETKEQRRRSQVEAEMRR